MKFPLEFLQKSWFIAGPTASGKSALAIHLARRIGGEVISMDSMAIYRRMDIGTAKPSLTEQAEVPHHCIDLVDPCEEYSTAEFLRAAIDACDQILSRNATPIFAGGTGLYLRSILRGVFEGPPADWDFRNKLIEESSQHPPHWLQEKLRQIDPATAARLHVNDTRRLIRALEIQALTGSPPSELQQETPLPVEIRPNNVFWIHPPREWLHHRINERVVRMFDAGLEEEVRNLLAEPTPPGKSASQALGYREVIDWFIGVYSSKEETLETIQTRTRQFSKRQHTWFRNLEECRELKIDGTEEPQMLVDRLIDMSETKMSDRN
ncbi:tRNA (adenosine(37)-N6)-dimethylallyltransferase MiaA [Planctomicrobium sp. SH668]|uniref:tRNA (adenosine(37)-N6)-dimethylallyltransferase MiaA n=1 Tax=Planctomicrobium sp. SH668 TaxID=3448126 RepID=UPI003F5BA144